MADTKTIMTDVEGRMQRAIDHLEEELNNVRAGKASPNVLNGVMVDYYGSMTPVSGVASVTVPDAKTILIQPWDKKTDFSNNLASKFLISALSSAAVATATPPSSALK